MGSAVVDGQAKLLRPKQSLTQQLLHNNKTPEINIPTLLITVQKKQYTDHNKVTS